MARDRMDEMEQPEPQEGDRGRCGYVVDDFWGECGQELVLVATLGELPGGLVTGKELRWRHVTRGLDALHLPVLSDKRDEGMESGEGTCPGE